MVMTTYGLIVAGTIPSFTSLRASRVEGADGEIATTDQADTAPHGSPLDAGNGGLGQGVQGFHQARQLSPVGEVFLVGIAAHSAHVVDVAACGKAPAVAGDDHHPHRGVCTGFVQGGDKARNLLVIEGVVDLGPVHRNVEHALGGE